MASRSLKVAPASRGHETDYFGLKTFQALKRFQKAHGLPATGYLGPLTRAAINAQ
jgi:peptidoglycan hydrolase-like protein with peptidoglycan-binding domain